MSKRDLALRIVEKKGYVNVSLLRKELGLTDDEACSLLQKLWADEKLMPMETAFFATPVDGKPASLRKEKGGQDWYAPYRVAAMAYIEAHPDSAVTVNEVMAAIEASRNVAKVTLRMLVVEGKLSEKTSSHGGLYGNRPLLFGMTTKAIIAKELELKRKVAENAKKRRGKKTSKDTNLPGVISGKDRIMAKIKAGEPIKPFQVRFLHKAGYVEETKIAKRYYLENRP